MNTEQQQIITTLYNIEILATRGRIGNPLTAMTARLLSLEISNSDTAADALERAEEFIIQCTQEYKSAAKAS